MSFLGGTLVIDGVVQTEFLGDGDAVPATAVFLAGIAHKQDGTRYVCAWPASDAVKYLRGEAIRDDGAQVIATTGATTWWRGRMYTDRGELLVTTSGSPYYLGGFGVTTDGALLVSAASAGTGPSGAALLLEDGSYLLAEDGSYLLLD